MKRRIIPVVLSMVLLVATVTGKARAEVTYEDEFSGIEVLYVGAMVSDSESSVLSADDGVLLSNLAYLELKKLIPASVEIKLQDPSFDDLMEPGTAALFVEVNAFERGDGGYYGSIRLAIYRAVSIWGNDEGLPFVAKVYENGQSMFGQSDPLSHVRKIVETMVPEFALDFVQSCF